MRSAAANIRRPRALRLQARIAALRVVARAAVRRDAGTWRRLKLRWRAHRRGAPYRRGPNAAVAGSTTTMWQPQFHLHISSRTGDRSGVAAATDVRTSVFLRERTVLDRRHAELRTRVLALRDMARRSGSSAVLSAGRAPSIAWSRPAGRPRRVSAGEWGAGARPRHRPIGWRQPVDQQLMPAPRAIRRSAVPILEIAEEPRRGRAISRSEALALRRRTSGSPEVERPRPRQRTPVEIVWRNPSREVAADSRAISTPRAIQGVASPSSGSSSPQSPSAAEPASGQSVAARVADLTPAMLDRVADDVIRRVERRVRIERERRGL